MENLTVSMLMTCSVGFVLWLIMLVIIIKNQFHNPKLKTIWLIALFVFPPSALLFPFIGMKQTK